MQRLFDIKKTQLEMVKDRGYLISPEEASILDMNLDQFMMYVNSLSSQLKRSVRSSLSRSYDAKDSQGKVIATMLVYYGGKTSPQQKQVSADIVREFIQLVQKYSVTEAVLIVDAPISSKGNEELSALKLTRWQVFFDHELTYNPTRHVDTPLHELIPPKEAQAKLRELKADISKLLIIKVTDPVVRYYGWQTGNLIRVHRNDRSISILAPKSINYRVIVG